MHLGGLQRLLRVRRRALAAAALHLALTAAGSHVCGSHDCRPNHGSSHDSGSHHGSSHHGSSHHCGSHHGAILYHISTITD